MSEFDYLIKEFGSAKSDSKPNAIVATPFDDLIKQFGSGKVQVAEPVASEAGKPQVPMSEAERASTPNADYSGGSLRRMKQGVMDAPANLWATFKDELGSASELVGEGVKDISQNRPLTGVGKAGLGLLSAVASPVTAASKELIEKPVTALTGSDSIGKKAGFIASLGIPLDLGATKINKLHPSNQAVDKLIDAIGEKNLPEVISRLKSNDRLSVIDVSPSAAQDAQALVIQPGAHKNDMTKYIENRQAGSRTAVEKVYDDTMGAPVDVVKKIEELKKRAKETGSREINPIVENSKPVDVTAAVNAIDAAIAKGGPVERKTLKALKEGGDIPLQLSPAQSKLFEIRERVRGDWKDQPQMYLDMKGEQGLHEVQKVLRAEAQGLLDSADPLQRELGNKMMKIRNQLVDAAPPEYRKALGKYAEDMQVQEAFDRGRFLLSNRPTKIEDRPESLREWLKSAKPDEIEAVREGARVAIDNQIRSMRFAAKKGSDIPEVEFNRAKLEMLFGKKEVEQLARKLADEKDIANSTNILLKGSQTASRQASNVRVDLPEHKGSNLAKFAAPVAEIAIAGSTGVQGAGLLVGSGQVASHLLHKGKTKLVGKSNEEYAKLLTAEGPARDELIKILESHLPAVKPSMLNRITNRLQNVIAP